MSNLHESLARQKKAGHILVVLLECGLQHTDAPQMDEGHWTLAAKAARVNPPSAATKAIVLADLLRVEQRRAA